jgi:hypothetical protein
MQREFGFVMAIFLKMPGIHIQFGGNILDWLRCYAPGDVQICDSCALLVISVLGSSIWRGPKIVTQDSATNIYSLFFLLDQKEPKSQEL